jgi:hypothetical protein
VILDVVLIVLTFFAREHQQRGLDRVGPQYIEEVVKLAKTK